MVERLHSDIWLIGVMVTELFFKNDIRRKFSDFLFSDWAAMACKSSGFKTDSATCHTACNWIDSQKKKKTFGNILWTRKSATNTAWLLIVALWDADGLRNDWTLEVKHSPRCYQYSAITFEKNHWKSKFLY